MHHFRTFITILALIGLWAEAAAQDVQAPTPAQRLASEFARSATMRLSMDPLTVNALQAGVGLISEAAALNPESAQYWHTALNVALMAENDELKSRALERLNTLDPDHDIARLMRFNAALDRFQVFEERRAAYERLLTDDNLPRLGEAVASRLALDLALLHQRRGEIDAFSRWLTKAVAWDRANRAAAAIAAGFFRSQVNDPAAVAELLVNLVIADPTDVSAQVDLARLLLEHGAFVGAERMYRLATRSMAKDFRSVPVGLVVDQAVAMWARGLDDQALEVLGRKQNELNLLYRLSMKRQRPEMTAEDILSLTLLDQSISTVTAVIHTSRDSREAAAATQTAILACLAAIKDLQDRAATVSADQAQLAQQIQDELAQRHLEAAWIALWLGTHVDQVQNWLDAAAAYQPLCPEARDRFAGWLALRTGELDKAIALLEPLAQTDPAARLGLAHALHQQGKLREAAGEFLAVNRTQPGSVIGIWAGARLKQIVGQSIGPTEQSVTMDRLIASISVQFDRAVEDPSLAYTLRVIPSKQTYEAYEPLRVTIQLTNNSNYPLGLDREGPIRPQVLILPSVRSAEANRSGSLRPFIIDLSRKLRLGPRETLVVQFDLRDYWPGEAINALAVNGALVKLRAFVNFAINPDGAAMAGLYGTEIEAPLLRVDGQRLTRPWLDESLELMRSTGGGDALLRRMAMFSHFIAPPPAQQATLEDRQYLDAARVAFAEAYAKLDGPSQAWLLCVMPRGAPNTVEGIQSVLAIARKSQDRLVTLAYLIWHASGWQDPMFDAAKRSDDSKLRAVAQAIEDDARLREEAGRR